MTSQHFLPFLLSFLLYQKEIAWLQALFKLSSENALHEFALFVWGFTLYQQYFSYLMATLHRSMFPGPFLTSTVPVYYPDTGGPVIVLFP